MSSDSRQHFLLQVLVLDGVVLPRGIRPTVTVTTEVAVYSSSPAVPQGSSRYAWDNTFSVFLKNCQCSTMEIEKDARSAYCCATGLQLPSVEDFNSFNPRVTERVRTAHAKTHMYPEGEIDLRSSVKLTICSGTGLSSSIGSLMLGNHDPVGLQWRILFANGEAVGRVLIQWFSLPSPPPMELPAVDRRKGFFRLFGGARQSDKSLVRALELIDEFGVAVQSHDVRKIVDQQNNEDMVQMLQMLKQDDVRSLFANGIQVPGLHTPLSSAPAASSKTTAAASSSKTGALGPVRPSYGEPRCVIPEASQLLIDMVKAAIGFSSNHHDFNICYMFLYISSTYYTTVYDAGVSSSPQSTADHNTQTAATSTSPPSPAGTPKNGNLNSLSGFGSVTGMASTSPIQIRQSADFCIMHVRNHRAFRSNDFWYNVFSNMYTSVSTASDTSGSRDSSTSTSSARGAQKHGSPPSKSALFSPSQFSRNVSARPSSASFAMQAAASHTHAATPASLESCARSKAFLAYRTNAADAAKANGLSSSSGGYYPMPSVDSILGFSERKHVTSMTPGVEEKIRLQAYLQHVAFAEEQGLDEADSRAAHVFFTVISLALLCGLDVDEVGEMLKYIEAVCGVPPRVTAYVDAFWSHQTALIQNHLPHLAPCKVRTRKGPWSQCICTHVMPPCHSDLVFFPLLQHQRLAATALEPRRSMVRFFFNEDTQDVMFEEPGGWGKDRLAAGMLKQVSFQSGRIVTPTNSAIFDGASKRGTKRRTKPTAPGDSLSSLFADASSSSLTAVAGTPTKPVLPLPILPTLPVDDDEGADTFDTRIRGGYSTGSSTTSSASGSLSAPLTRPESTSVSRIIAYRVHSDSMGPPPSSGDVTELVVEDNADLDLDSLPKLMNRGKTISHDEDYFAKYGSNRSSRVANYEVEMKLPEVLPEEELDTDADIDYDDVPEDYDSDFSADPENENSIAGPEDDGDVYDSDPERNSVGLGLDIDSVGDCPVVPATPAPRPPVNGLPQSISTGSTTSVSTPPTGPTPPPYSAPMVQMHVNRNVGPTPPQGDGLFRPSRQRGYSVISSMAPNSQLAVALDAAEAESQLSHPDSPANATLASNTFTNAGGSVGTRANSSGFTFSSGAAGTGPSSMSHSAQHNSAIHEHSGSSAGGAVGVANTVFINTPSGERQAIQLRFMPAEREVARLEHVYCLDMPGVPIPRAVDASAAFTNNTTAAWYLNSFGSNTTTGSASGGRLSSQGLSLSDEGTGLGPGYMTAAAQAQRTSSGAYGAYVPGKASSATVPPPPTLPPIPPQSTKASKPPPFPHTSSFSGRESVAVAGNPSVGPSSSTSGAGSGAPFTLDSATISSISKPFTPVAQGLLILSNYRLQFIPYNPALRDDPRYDVFRDIPLGCIHKYEVAAVDSEKTNERIRKIHAKESADRDDGEVYVARDMGLTSVGATSTYMFSGAAHGNGLVSVSSSSSGAPSGIRFSVFNTVESAGETVCHIRCKDVRQATFSLCDPSGKSDLSTKKWNLFLNDLKARAFPPTPFLSLPSSAKVPHENQAKLYAFNHGTSVVSVQQDGWAIFNPRREFERQGALQLNEEYEQLSRSRSMNTPAVASSIASRGVMWILSDINKNFELCGSYPDQLVLPNLTSMIKIFQTIHQGIDPANIPSTPVLPSGKRGSTIGTALAPTSSLSLMNGSVRGGIIDFSIFSNLADFESNDALYKKAAKFRSKNRLPSLTYYYRRTRASILRSSQPLSGLTNSRWAPDEQLLRLCGVEVIIDCRPKANATANALKGGGYEKCGPNGNYKNAVIEFLDIENIHVMRSALKKVHVLCRQLCGHAMLESVAYAASFHAANLRNGFLQVGLPTALQPTNVNSNQNTSSTAQQSQQGQHGNSTAMSDVETGRIAIDAILHFDKSNKHDNSSSASGKAPVVKFYETEWLTHLQACLKAAVKTALLVHNSHTVLVHCSDGWDRTAQVCALAEVLLDPYYRTVAGFTCLITKEFVAFGHKFAHRLGHGSPDHSDKERSPIFIQFLDTVVQVMLQFPTAFQFGVNMVEHIAQHAFSARFGTFMGNSELDRRRLNTRTKTESVWTHILKDCAVTVDEVPSFDQNGALIHQSRINGGSRFLYSNYTPIDGPIWPNTDVRKITLWPFYFRWDIAMQ